jgi:hypothetical protein
MQTRNRTQPVHYIAEGPLLGYGASKAKALYSLPDLGERNPHTSASRQLNNLTAQSQPAASLAPADCPGSGANYYISELTLVPVS